MGNREILWLKLEKCYILKTLPTKFCPILALVLRKFTKGIRNHLLRYIKMVVTLLANCVIPQCGTFQTSKNKSCIIWRERIWSRSQGTQHWHPFFSNWVLRLCIQRIRFHSIEETIIGIRRRNLWAIWFITHQDILKTVTPITKNCEYNIINITSLSRESVENCKETDPGHSGTTATKNISISKYWRNNQPFRHWI